MERDGRLDGGEVVHREDRDVGGKRGRPFGEPRHPRLRRFSAARLAEDRAFAARFRAQRAECGDALFRPALGGIPVGDCGVGGRMAGGELPEGRLGDGGVVAEDRARPTAAVGADGIDENRRDAGRYCGSPRERLSGGAYAADHAGIADALAHRPRRKVIDFDRLHAPAGRQREAPHPVKDAPVHVRVLGPVQVENSLRLGFCAGNGHWMRR